MEERRPDRHPRTPDFLDTVAFGSLLVFASVMPPLPPERERDTGANSRLPAAQPDQPSTASLTS
jgi:hypothetical protein